MNPEYLRGRRVVVLGFGADVRAAIPKLAERSPAQWLLVDSAPGVVAQAVDGVISIDGVDLKLVDLDEGAARAEVFLRSPGFPRYLPALEVAGDRGALMTTPVDLFMGSLGSDQEVVLVTGTKGKSTTTDLLGHFLHAAGVRTGIAGNLGIPVFADGWDSDAPVIVIEVSSYQAADLHHVPDIAVLTSLTQDHLSWHGGVERYVADKLRVVSNDSGTAPVVIVSADEPGALEAVKQYLPVVVETPADIDHLPRQRVQNAALAAAVLHRLVGVRLSDGEIRSGATATMPGRLDPCPTPAGRWDDVLFIDDTLASNPSAAAAGLRWGRSTGRPVAIILGGTDRGVSVEPLAEEVAGWDPAALRAVTVADNGDSLARQAGIQVLGRAESVTQAVQMSANWIESLADSSAAVYPAENSNVVAQPPGWSSTLPGGIVLFSPAAPTPARQGSWKDRSAEFRAAVSALQ